VFFKNVQGLAIIVRYQPHDTVIHGIAGGNGVNIDFGFGESIGEARERARTVIEENSQLFSEVHKIEER